MLLSQSGKPVLVLSLDRQSSSESKLSLQHPGKEKNMQLHKGLFTTSNKIFIPLHLIVEINIISKDRISPRPYIYLYISGGDALAGCIVLNTWSRAYIEIIKSTTKQSFRDS